ncbi:TolB family protein [Dyella terrae]|uniref:Xaa-Pro aminopeptidase n=2 Tax=Dyella TaxID=231454 RepID=A0A4R0YX78_9GAMM|nr:PD40 domain-containing protein [Dyella terrae]TBR39222.1 hypothetical protein EYV96_03040 [Dyella terrae]TCI13191.1 hypothetical protein EZM97_07825 [Dyella soli]
MPAAHKMVFALALSVAASPNWAADKIPAAATWAPSAISSPMFESHGAFDPVDHAFYFVRSTPQFKGWRIMVSHCQDDGWSTPLDASFAGDGVEADPFITPDGKHLYFISTRSTDGVHRKDLDIWRVDRGADGTWGEPQRLPEPVNSSGQEWFPRPGSDGWLYFGSDRPGGHGKTDIWRARQDAQGIWRVENLGPNINTSDDEYEPLPSPDGSRLVVMAGDGLYESRLKDGVWTSKHKLGPPVGVNGTEIGSTFSPSGRTLMFARDTKGPKSGEFFVWHREGNEAWPPTCPLRSTPLTEEARR